MQTPFNVLEIKMLNIFFKKLDDQHTFALSKISRSIVSIMLNVYIATKCRQSFVFHVICDVTHLIETIIFARIWYSLVSCITIKVLCIGCLKSKEIKDLIILYRKNSLSTKRAEIYINEYMMLIVKTSIMISASWIKVKKNQQYFVTAC